MPWNGNDAYPKQRLLFFIAQDVDENIRDVVAKCVRGLADGSDWSINPPIFIDTVDNSTTREGDSPDEIVGGFLEIYSAIDGALPRDVDATNLSEVERLVEAVRKLSSAECLDVEFELDGVFVGAIDCGRLDKSLAQGLLEEWRHHLESQK